MYAELQVVAASSLNPNATCNLNPMQDVERLHDEHRQLPKTRYVKNDRMQHCAQLRFRIGVHVRPYLQQRITALCKLMARAVQHSEARDSCPQWPDSFLWLVSRRTLREMLAQLLIGLWRARRIG